MGRLKISSGFTLVEAMVAGVIASIAVAGVVASVSSLRKPAVLNDKNLQAAYCGQEFLQDMRVQVDSRTWNTVQNALTVGTYSVNDLTPYKSCVSLAATRIDYTVYDAGNGARKVQIQVIWP